MAPPRPHDAISASDNTATNDIPPPTTGDCSANGDVGNGSPCYGLVHALSSTPNRLLVGFSDIGAS